MEQTKKCTKCGPQALSEFNKNKSKADGLATECRKCSKAYGKTYYADNSQKWVDYEAKRRGTMTPEEWAQDLRKKQATHRASPTNTIRLRYLKTRYGITPEQYEAMLARQAGVCAICRNPSRGSTRRLHVDHDHATGKVRGLLCFSCNAGLGHFADNLRWLEATIQYLMTSAAADAADVAPS